jgi:transposase-like protein
MNVIELFQTFKTQEQALTYLETIRWRGRTVCPYCGSEKVGRHASGDREMSRWQCRHCDRTFSPTVGTIFHGTHIPLKDWFLVIALMLNAKKSASSCQIARDIGRRQPTVWSMMHRVRIAMADDPYQKQLLHGIIEADETYVGGKPRRQNRHDKDGGGGKSKRGRGTSKAAIIGVIERGGRVIAKPAEAGELSARGLAKFISRFVDPRGSLLITDEYRGYSEISRKMPHAAVNHAKEYAFGQIHTNTIEGFWATVKRTWYGQHHHWSRKYLALYIAEACYKYNRRNTKDGFDGMVEGMVYA